MSTLIVGTLICSIILTFIYFIMNYNPNVQDDILVNLQEEYKKRQIQEVLDELEQDLIGLVPV